MNKKQDPARPASPQKGLNIDLTKNPKQEEFYQKALAALQGENLYRNLFYGGAIRGGKTFVSLAILARACEEYPGSRWHVFRRDFPALLATTIPSMQKLLSGLDSWTWTRDKANYFVEHKEHGSRIFFKGENIDRDPWLNDLLGLETNGILFEQIEELTPQLWQMGLSRIGSWYLEKKMPAAVTFSTFNPTQGWIKRMIYEPYKNGTLKPPFYYMSALPSDNHFVTKEQWDAWDRLDERYRLQYIKGDWTDFSDRSRMWAFAFDRAKHVVEDEIPVQMEYPLHLSFDFNKNPICCSVIQHIDRQIRVIETIKLANSDIYALCQYIQACYPQHLYIVTGDASGSHSSALVQGNLNYYTVIKKQLNLNHGQLNIPTVNPRLSENQVLVNSILSRYDVRINATKAQSLVYDLANVKMDNEGSLLKANRADPSQQADALDTFRYYCNVFHRDFLKW